MTVAVEANLIKVFKPAYEAPIISHLQLAVDTIIYCKVNKEIKNVGYLVLFRVR